MKLRQLRKYMKKQKIDVVVLPSKDANFYYLLQQSLDTGMMLVFRKKRPVILITSLSSIKAKGFTIIRTNDFVKTIKEIFRKNKIRKLGINYSTTRILLYIKLRRLGKIINMDDFLSELPMTKTDYEIKKLKKACSLTDAIFKKLVKNFKFRTEKDIVNFLKIEAIRNDCEPSFEPIVANGINATTPHYNGNSRLKKGFLIIDYGLKWQGYCSDMTRTFYLGKPSEKEKLLYNKMLRIQQQAIEKCRPGVKAVDVDRFVRKELGDDAKYFFHGLGHGIGIRIHERPSLHSKSKDILKNNMVFTIEPGYYHKFGIRIEDDVALIKGKPVILTKFPKRLIAIDRFK